MQRQTELICPSGLHVKFRSIKGKDLDGMRDRQKVATGEAMTILLNECTLEVLDRSIYGHLKSFDWADALVGDRTAALIGLREATNGAMYDFNVRCQDSMCKRMIPWRLNLTELEKKPLPEESKETYVNGNKFAAKCNGDTLTFKLNTGRDQLKLARAISQLRRSSQSKEGHQEKVLLGLASRLVAVEGVQEIFPWLEELDLVDIVQLTKSMDAVDCGIETGLSVECSSCGLQQEIDLPLDSQFFAQDI